MTQSDLNVANGSGAVVRADINVHLDAIATNNSGGSAPLITFPNQWWFDTTNNQLKQRDNANTVWVLVAQKIASDWIPYRNGVLIGDVATRTVGNAATNVVALDANGRFVLSGNQAIPSFQTLSTTGGASTPDFDLGQDCLLTLTETTTINNPSNAIEGAYYTFIFTQAAAGGPFSVSWQANFDFVDNNPPVMPSTVSARMVVSFRAAAGLSLQEVGRRLES